MVSAARPTHAPTNAQVHGARRLVVTSTAAASASAAMPAVHASLLIVTAMNNIWGLKAAMAAAAMASVGTVGKTRRASHQVQSSVINPPSAETNRAPQAGATTRHGASGIVTDCRRLIDSSQKALTLRRAKAAASSAGQPAPASAAST